MNKFKDANTSNKVKVRYSYGESAYFRICRKYMLLSEPEVRHEHYILTEKKIQQLFGHY